MSDVPDAHLRPERFRDGLQIGMHLTLESFVSTGPNRTYYLANNFRPRWYTRICWRCGHKHNPVSAESCVYCQTPIRPRRFLLSARYGSDVRAFHAFAAQRLQHVGLASPIVLYELEKQVLAFYEVSEEALLIDEPRPLHPRTLLASAFSLAGALQHLHRHGVVLRSIGPEHVLAQRERARLFDLDVAEVRRRALPPGDAEVRRNVCELGALLRTLVPLDQPDLAEFFAEVEEDVFLSALAFQREIRRLARDRPQGEANARQAVLSVVGRVRSENEDAWGWRELPQARVHVVADGMGGYLHGARASATAIQTVLAEVEARLPAKKPARAEAEKLLQGIVQATHDAVKQVGVEAAGPLGTTLVLAVIWPDQETHIVHVGDSRAYLVREGSLQPLTEDHSMVAAMVASGKLDAEQARTHPKSNVLLQFLGGPTTPEADLTVHQGRAGDQLLLCTDGVWGQLEGRQLAERVTSSQKLRRQVRSVVVAALEAGGSDNATALLVDL